MTPRPLALVRSVVGIEEGPGWVDLALETVSAVHLGPTLGLLTGEDPETQGVVTGLPNLPPLPALPVDRTAATLRVRFAAPDALRLTLVPARAGEPGDDDAPGDGILVDPRPGSGSLEVTDEGSTIAIASDALVCRVARHPFAVTCVTRAGEPVVSTGGDRRQVAGLPFAPALGTGPEGCSMALELAPDEVITGLGEQFGPPARNGQRLTLSASDALGTGSQAVYKAAPVFHSTAGYTGFVHTPGPVVADVGATWPAVLQVEVGQDVLDLFLIVHPDPKVRLTRYAELTGRPPRVPRWALGVWMSRCRYPNREEVVSVTESLRRHRVPCDVVHLDPDWLERDRLSCDFAWSRQRFGDPATLVGRLGEAGFRLSLWECPYLDPDSPRHAEAAARGYLVADGTGQPASLAGITADGRPRALVDFSNPAARAWWQDLHRELLALGVAVFTTDFGEGLPEDAVMADGRSGRAWRNLYPLWYNRTVAEVTREATGGPGLVWGRSGWAGSQRYPGQWGGDPESSVAGMAATLRAGLSWAVSAPGLWGHDIGGFSGAGPTPELYVRWAQWGCLSPLARFHGIGPREPWAYGERALGIVRDFAALRYRLLPYLGHLVGEAARWGWPVLRPLALEHPGDRGCWGLAHQYLLGADLLVVPVLDDGPGPVQVPCYLPPGTWVDWWSGEVRHGPGWVVEEAPLERLPLFVRGGAVVPLGPEVQHTGEASAEAPWTLHAFPDPGRPARGTELLDDGTAWHAQPVLGDDGGVRAVALAGTGGEAPARRAAGAVVHLPGARLAEVPVVGA